MIEDIDELMSERMVDGWVKGRRDDG